MNLALAYDAPVILRGELPIRDEAVNYFLGVPSHEQPELELTYNFGVDSYELGTGYGHVAVAVDDMDQALSALREKGIEPEKPPRTACARAAR